MATLPLFQVQFTNSISLSHCIGCLDTPDSFSILGAHTEIISLQHFLWQYVLHVDIYFSWFSQVCLLSSCLCSPNNSSHCVFHNSQHGRTFCCFCGFFFFHLTERQAMMLGHMSSLEGHASYKPLSVGKIAFFLFLIFTSSLKFTLVCFLTLFFPAIFPTHYVLNTLSNFYFSFKAYISPNCFPPTQWVMYVYSILEFHF